MIEVSRSRNTKRCDGFTLVEVLVSLAIFTMVSLTIFQLYRLGLGLAESAKDMNRITQIMQTQIEYLRTTKFELVKDMGTSKLIKVDAHGIAVDSGGEIPFRWKAFALTQKMSLEKSGFYKVKLVADWTDRFGRRHVHSLETWITEGGLNEFYTRST